MVKKKIESLSQSEKRSLISVEEQGLSVSAQCEIVGLARSSYYYVARQASAETLAIMAAIDKQYMQTPFYGSPRMTTVLRSQGYRVNEKRVARMMRQMGIMALYPKPRTSVGSKANKIYPYLLRGLEIERVNQVWSTDITYIGLPCGWMYLMAVMDWRSRYVIHWELGNTMDAHSCTNVLKESLRFGMPEIFNTDQGAQFTSEEFTGVLLEKDIRISMDGKGRALDNVFVERLWRTVKYEDIYIRNYESVSELRSGLREYFTFYNTERIHTKLNNRTPLEIYNGA